MEHSEFSSSPLESFHCCPGRLQVTSDIHRREHHGVPNPPGGCLCPTEPEDKIMSAPLSTFRSGQVVCDSLSGEGPEVVRLKRMGICSGRRIDVIQTGDPMILGVVGTRLGISRKLASRVLVSSAEDTATDSPPQ